MPRPSPYPTEVVPLIVAGYTSGKSMYELADEFGGNRTTVRRRLVAAGVTLRSREERQKRLPCREDAFADAENDDEAAYWVGMLMADGCISTTKHSTWVILTLGVRDAEHVERFRTFLNSTHKILIAPEGLNSDLSRHGEARNYRVASKRMAADLARYGVVSRKTKIAEVKHLEMNRHFWRGVVDGDGSLGLARRNKPGHRARPVLQVVGSETLMRQFEVFARAITGTQAKAHLSHACWGFRIFSGAAAEMISHLYTDCTVALARKWALAHELLCEWELRERRRTISGRAPG